MVNNTWATRCDRLQFVTNMEDPSLPAMVVNSSGRHNLWGKTKMMFNQSSNEFPNVDWVLKVGLVTDILVISWSSSYGLLQYFSINRQGEHI